MLISDVYTDTVRRKKMADKRSRKMATVLEHLPRLEARGPTRRRGDAGWLGFHLGRSDRGGRTVESGGHLDEPSADQIPGALPRHRGLRHPGQEPTSSLWRTTRAVSSRVTCGQRRASSLRVTSAACDGEPFEPKHIVAAVKELLANGTELIEVLSTERGWQTEHPTGTSGDWTGTSCAAVGASTLTT